MILSTQKGENNRGGNGRFGTLARRKQSSDEEAQGEDFSYLDKNDLRMRFNNSRDPIYFAFEYLEKRSVPELAGDFVKDAIFEITNFVAKVVK